MGTGKYVIDWVARTTRNPPLLRDMGATDVLHVTDRPVTGRWMRCVLAALLTVPAGLWRPFDVGVLL